MAQGADALGDASSRSGESQDDATKVARGSRPSSTRGHRRGPWPASDRREANIRAGWVYVISNIGSFGEDMVKIGMTRRLEPMDRVRELGDASVPFTVRRPRVVLQRGRASASRTSCTRELADRRVNRVNLRREFFRATPAEVLDVLGRTEAREHLLEYTEFAEAEEWRTSLALSENPAPDPAS